MCFLHGQAQLGVKGREGEYFQIIQPIFSPPFFPVHQPRPNLIPPSKHHHFTIPSFYSDGINFPARQRGPAGNTADPLNVAEAGSCKKCPSAPPSSIQKAVQFSSSLPLKNPKT
jgi:hypothetical protein